MKEKIKNKNAITLLALIITVIILLILATVSISLIINSGILDHAQHGVDRYSKEEDLEQIKLAVASARLKGNGFLTADNLNTELQTRFNNEDEVIETSKYWNYKGYKIKENGEVIKNLLPAEYQQVEYIENTDQQYIDTLFMANNNTSIWCDCIITDKLKSGYYQGLFGAATGTNEMNRLAVHLGAADKKVCGIYYDYKKGYGFFNGDITQRHIYKLEKNIYKTDDNILYTCTETNFNCTESITIFKENNITSPGKRNCLMKLYSFIIYDNNNLVNYFVPCYSTTTVTDVDGIERPKDTIGLYDTVEGKFYVNQGTGTFLKGADV